MKHSLRSFVRLVCLTLGLSFLSACSRLPTPVPQWMTFTPVGSIPTVALPTQAPATATAPAPAVFTAAPTFTRAPATAVPATLPPAASSVPLPANRQPIRFAPNTTTYALVASLVAGTPQAYSLNISAGQHVFFTLNGSAWIQVVAPDGQLLVPAVRNVGPWEMVAAQKGDYVVVLKGEGAVTVGIYIRPLNSSAAAAAPVPVNPQPIQFQKNAISTTLTINLAQGAPQAFTLAAQKGQLVSVRATGSTTLSCLAPDGSLVLPNLAIPSHWQFALPQNGANSLVFIGQGSVTFTLTVPPAAPPRNKVVPASRTRVTFAPDTATATIPTTLVSGTPQGYTLRVIAGQRIYIAVTGQAEVQVLGAGDAQLPTLGGVGLWAVDASQTGDYTVVVFGSGATTITIFVPPL